MKCNVGKRDRMIRIFVAALFVVLIAAGAVQGTAAVILGILAAVLLVTSIVRFCALYVPLKIDTTEKK